MKKFIEEFKTFINRGNVIDLAVGVVVGGAFTTIVDSMVNDIVMPIIGRIIGGFDFSSLKIALGGDSYIMIGSFIQNIVNFLLIAFVVFAAVKGVNKLHELEKKEEAGAKEEEPEESAEVKLLKSIEKELKKLNKK